MLFSHFCFADSRWQLPYTQLVRDTLPILPCSWRYRLLLSHPSVISSGTWPILSVLHIHLFPYVPKQRLCVNPFVSEIGVNHLWDIFCLKTLKHATNNDQLIFTVRSWSLLDYFWASGFAGYRMLNELLKIGCKVSGVLFTSQDNDNLVVFLHRLRRSPKP